MLDSIILKNPKRLALKIDEESSNKILEILEMGSMSIKKHEWGLGSTTKHKMAFGDLGCFVI